MLHNWGYNNKQIDRYDGREYSNLPDIDDDYLFILQNLVNKKKDCVENVDDPELMLFLGDLVNFENSFGFVSKGDGTCNFIAYERLTDSWGTQIKGKTKEQAGREVKDEGKKIENNADMVEISNSLDENSEEKIQDNGDDLEVVGEKRTDENQDDENRDDGGIVEGGCGSTDVERSNREGSMTLTKNVSHRGRKKGSVMKIEGGRFEKGGKRRAQHSPHSFNRKKRCLTKEQDYVHENGTRCSTRKPKFMHDSGEVEPELLAYKGMSFSSCYDTYLEYSVVEGDSTGFAYNERKHNCCDNDVDASSDSDVEVMDKAPNCTEKKFTPVADTETEEDDLQCTGERKQTENPQFRKEVEHLLREPYNKEEYERLWSDVNSRKLMEGHKELRGRSIKIYPKDRTGKSYLDHYFDLHGPLNDFKDDLPRKLNVLRGFFHYMKHMSGDGVFKPWLDKSCLSIAPGSE